MDLNIATRGLSLFSSLRDRFRPLVKSNVPFCPGGCLCSWHMGMCVSMCAWLGIAINVVERSDDPFDEVALPIRKSHGAAKGDQHYLRHHNNIRCDQQHIEGKVSVRLFQRTQKFRVANLGGSKPMSVEFENINSIKWSSNVQSDVGSFDTRFGLSLTWLTVKFKSKYQTW